MKQIPLTQGKFAIVDDEDFEMLSKFKWCLRLANGKTYAYRRAKNHEKHPSKTVKMHRFILNIVDPKIEVDHIDSNGLNNQRYNIRPCTHSQNLKNRGRQKNNTSGFKGVFWSKNAKKWEASVKVNAKKIYLGLFLIKENAARAYDAYAKEHFGEFAKLNFP